jgi:hypothetical protein
VAVEEQRTTASATREDLHPSRATTIDINDFGQSVAQSEADDDGR